MVVFDVKHLVDYYRHRKYHAVMCIRNYSGNAAKYLFSDNFSREPLYICIERGGTHVEA